MKNLTIITLVIVAALFWTTQRNVILQEWLDWNSPITDKFALNTDQSIWDMPEHKLTAVAIQPDIWRIKWQFDKTSD